METPASKLYDYNVLSTTFERAHESFKKEHEQKLEAILSVINSVCMEAARKGKSQCHIHSFYLEYDLRFFAEENTALITEFLKEKLKESRLGYLFYDTECGFSVRINWD